MKLTHSTFSAKTGLPVMALHIIQTANLLTQAADRVLRDQLNLTHAQTSVLLVMHVCGPLSQTELAQQLRLTTAAISRLCDVLVEKKLLHRTINPHNRRANILDLTPLGRKNILHAITILNEAELLVFGHPEAQLNQQLLKYLNKICTTLHPLAEAK